jgi:hypothetical protein
LGFHYLPSTADSSSTSLPFILVLSDPDHILQVTFTNLSPTGAPITIGTFDSFEQGPSGSRRDIVAGSVVVASAVPEPTTFSLASTAVVVAGAVLTYRRRRRVALD